jgi:hypothetical protein
LPLLTDSLLSLFFDEKDLVLSAFENHVHTNFISAGTHVIVYPETKVFRIACRLDVGEPFSRQRMHSAALACPIQAKAEGNFFTETSTTACKEI